LRSGWARSWNSSDKSMGDDRLCWFSASGYVYLASLFHSSLGKTLALEHGLKDLLGNGYEGGEKSWQILRANGAMFELESYPLGVLGQSKSRK